MTGKSVALFAAAALAEIGGAYLVWIGLRDGKGPVVVALGVLALGLYGVVATLQPENEFGRVLAAYGGVFIVGSIAWGAAFDSFRPDRYDLGGAMLCLLGVAVIMYAPR
jgi:small multidrug resistance family-3 protein